MKQFTLKVFFWSSEYLKQTLYGKLKLHRDCVRDDYHYKLKDHMIKNLIVFDVLKHCAI